MKRKNKSPKTEQLSPEKYIENRARKLPVHECLVSLDWDKGKQPGILVSRKHSNGNITACFYLVDLLCLGVIFTRYFFNISQEYYEELAFNIFENSPQAHLRSDYDNEEPFERISYNLAHNIIYAGYEYAAEFDIPPCKDFSVTKYMLEEDADEIELVDIDCGMDGKPLFLIENLTDYNGFKPEYIIKKLNQFAGEGNYTVINKVDYRGSDDDELDESDEADLYDEHLLPDGYIHPDDYTSEDFEEDKKYLEEFLEDNAENTLENKSEEDVKFRMIVLRMGYYLADIEKVNNVYEELFGKEVAMVEPNYIPYELLPLEEMDNDLAERIEDIVDDVFSDDTPDTAALLEELHEILPNQPFIAFLELVALHSRNEKDKTIKELLKKYNQLYPHDSIIELFNLYYKLLDAKDHTFLSREQLKFRNWFPDRFSLHITEAMVYCTLVTVVMHHKNSLEDLIALSEFMIDINLPYEINHNLLGLVLMGIAEIVIAKTLT